MTLSPICLFTYNRLEETKKTVNALISNHLASNSELYIFSDGYKNDKEKIKVENVRKYIKTINGFRKVTIFESSINKGLADSIIFGVSKVINKHNKVIVLEDDLITSPNFLDFMNQALCFYENNNKIFSISGYSMKINYLVKYFKKDYYFGYRASSWGWGTWSKDWNQIDWEIENYNDFIKSKKLINKFKRGGGDLPKMLHNQMKGKIDSWAIRWCYNQSMKDQLTVFPRLSKVISIGFGDNATHTKKINRFKTELDIENKRIFFFEESILINKNITKQLKDKFSILNRIFNKLF
jgi:hypothetical protein